MKPFSYHKAVDVADAVSRVHTVPGNTFIAGGTDLLQLWKTGAAEPDLVVDITGLPLEGVTRRPDRLIIGALTRLYPLARDPGVVDEFQGVAEALLASASPQIRNMATVGGNLLQRTRCSYFRTERVACNKRTPGSGCPARHGDNRGAAIFGWHDHCVAVHASDLAVALTAFDAQARMSGPGGERSLPVAALYPLPDATSQPDSVLDRGEIILQIEIPRSPDRRASSYLKVRDRASFEFALASLCTVLGRDKHGMVTSARLAAGGVAPRPWRLHGAEDVLIGTVLNERSIAAAAAQAAEGARPLANNGFKPGLLQRLVARALQQVGCL